MTKVINSRWTFFLKFCFFFFSALFLTRGYGQTVKLDEFLSQVKCTDFNCFNTFAKANKFDFIRKANDGPDIYHRFESQQPLSDDSGNPSKVVIHYAILRDNVFNSSIATTSSAYASRLLEEFRLLGFTEIQSDDSAKNRTWYTSQRYHDINLMFEKLTRTTSGGKNELLWHIGVVWSKPTLRSCAFKRGVNISHWLGQLFDNMKYGDPEWFNQEDVAWISSQGFDHLRVRVSGSEWLQRDGTLNEENLAYFDSVLLWSSNHNLGVVLSMVSFPQFPVDSSKTIQQRKEEEIGHNSNFWRMVARRFAHAGDYLRFDLNNRAGLSNSLNLYNLKLIEAVRESNPTRKLYISSGHNEMANGAHPISEMILPDDPHIGISFNYFEPRIFVLQYMQPWEFPAGMPQINFPGTVPDLTRVLPENHWAYKLGGSVVNEEGIYKDFSRIAGWIRKSHPDVEIYVSEWGNFLPTHHNNDESITNFIKAFTAAAAKCDFSWAIYDYNSSLGIRDESGNATANLIGLSLPKP